MAFDDEVVIDGDGLPEGMLFRATFRGQLRHKDWRGVVGYIPKPPSEADLLAAERMLNTIPDGKGDFS